MVEFCELYGEVSTLYAHHLLELNQQRQETSHDIYKINNVGLSVVEQVYEIKCLSHATKLSGSSQIVHSTGLSQWVPL